MAEQNETSFRDQLSTLDESGKRKWIYPKKPKGKLTRYRNIVNIFLLTFLFGAPFVKIGGEPLILFNVISRKFVILGQVFGPQDLNIFLFIFLSFIVAFILFTVVFGRIFCGWICPQTIFMEGVFRKIEYWIEGDYKHQQKLNKQPWNTEKIIKKGSKQLIFLLISFLIANTFLAYIIGYEELFTIITDPPSEHIGGLASISIFSLLFYGVFAKFREQVCTNVCPYGRMQGVLLIPSTIVVAYDYIRGEKRGKFRKNEDRTVAEKGDCIDCNQCVNVCPTGIDIRNGTQLECVNCTACIDACNHMMDSVGLPQGLIRYDSEEGIKTGVKDIWNLRTIAYSAVLVILMSISLILLINRGKVDANILRARGTDIEQLDNGDLKILYTARIINRTGEKLPVNYQVEGGIAQLEFIKKKDTLAPQEAFETPVFVIINNDKLQSTETKITIQIISDNETIGEMDLLFNIPKSMMR